MAFIKALGMSGEAPQRISRGMHKLRTRHDARARKVRTRMCGVLLLDFGCQDWCHESLMVANRGKVLATMAELIAASAAKGMRLPT